METKTRKENDAVLGTQVLPSPEPWTPSWQIPLGPGLSLLQCDVIGDIPFGESWHSWRQHRRDAIWKLQRAGHLAGGVRKRLERDEEDNVKKPIQVVEMSDEEVASQGDFFMRVPMEYGKPLDLLRALRPCRLRLRTKACLAAADFISRKEYAEKHGMEQEQVCLYTHLAEQQNLRASGNG